MTSQMVRGYAVKQTFAFMDKYFDGPTSSRVLGALAPDVAELKTTIKDGEWYPRHAFMTQLSAIAHVKNDDKGSYDDLVACGEFIASEAANTFLRLVLKILSPAQFAKKIPQLFERDHRGGGKFEVTSVGDRHIDLSLLDVKGFDHIGAVSVGWIKFGLHAMGKESVNVALTGWSVKQPGPEQVHYRVQWGQ